LRKDDFYSDVSMLRQIESHVRELILSGKLPAATRLPSMRELGKLWGTSYRPVQRAFSLLAREGLLRQSTEKGTFVASRSASLDRICLYHNEGALSSVDEFYSRLNISLYRLLSIRGIVSIPYFDHRDWREMGKTPEKIRQLVQNREIDALIATSILPDKTEWMRHLGIPIASMMLLDADNLVEIDLEAFAERAVDLARSRNRKRIGLIQPPGDVTAKGGMTERLFTAVERHAAKAGISVTNADCHATEYHWEKMGDDLCEKLLAMEPRVDFILVYPDAFIRGVAAALVRHRVSVPDEITVVSHRNLEIPIYIPFPMTWLTIRIDDFAQGLLTQLERQIKGEKVRPIELGVEVEPVSPDKAIPSF
jgi:DNA-binding transcriptional regulator YhcF (GntR family)